MIYHRNPLDYQMRRYLVWAMIAAGILFFLCALSWQHRMALPPLPLSDHTMLAPNTSAGDEITGAGRG